jgi:hypothetical protein
MSGGRLTPQEFVAKWRGVELSERASVQEHFLDLCVLFGHATPATADPTGAFFTFEKGVTKTGGGQGFADVWKRGPADGLMTWGQRLAGARRIHGVCVW